MVLGERTSNRSDRNSVGNRPEKRVKATPCCPRNVTLRRLRYQGVRTGIVLTIDSWKRRFDSESRHVSLGFEGSVSEGERG